MTFKTFSTAVVLGLALSGTGYAACNQAPKVSNDQDANSVAYQQFAPPTENQGANSAAYYQFERNRNSGGSENQGANSVVACK